MLKFLNINKNKGFHLLVFSCLSFLIVFADNENFDISEGVFKNIYAKGGPEKGTINWALDYNAIEYIKGKKLFIKYNTDIGEKRHISGMEDSNFMYSGPLDISTLSYEIAGLSGNEKYVFYIGISDTGTDDGAIYSSKGSFKTDRAWGIIKFLILMGALSFFIYGMKVMSEGLQQAAGKRLRNEDGTQIET